MKNKCLDIGILQGFVDGELADSEAERVIRHIALCESCPLVLADLETQNDLVFAALDAEHNVLVPTERLRAKVFASISESESSGGAGFLTRWLVEPLSFLVRPGFATVAGVLLFAALFSIGFRIMNGTGPDSEVAVTEPVPEVREAAVEESGPESLADAVNAENTGVMDNPAPVQISRPESGVGRNRLAAATKAVYRIKNSNPGRVNDSNENVPAVRRSPELDAEEGYLTTIATLSRTVNENKDYVLRPSERVDYERNLAVVDDAIKKMKGEVRNDPSNSAAREVLRSSYKNKIDLLNSVAERTETVASLD